MYKKASTTTTSNATKKTAATRSKAKSKKTPTTTTAATNNPIAIENTNHTQTNHDSSEIDGPELPTQLYYLNIYHPSAALYNNGAAIDYDAEYFTAQDIADGLADYNEDDDNDFPHSDMAVDHDEDQNDVPTEYHIPQVWDDATGTYKEMPWDYVASPGRNVNAIHGSSPTYPQKQGLQDTDISAASTSQQQVSTPSTNSPTPILAPRPLPTDTERDYFNESFSSTSTTPLVNTHKSLPPTQLSSGAATPVQCPTHNNELKLDQVVSSLGKRRRDDDDDEDDEIDQDEQQQLQQGSSSSTAITAPPPPAPTPAFPTPAPCGGRQAIAATYVTGERASARLSGKRVKVDRWYR
ncbi:hypothetical protein HDU76_005118 [Blyttiomyces sp. JEL0837]|nr:hypothetical protein HDU76_005118 [Blyttiomyces sp. JEL0837]